MHPRLYLSQKLYFIIDKNTSTDNNPPKREYAATQGHVFDKHASNRPNKHMDFANIAVDVATLAYEQRCCTKT